MSQMVGGRVMDGSNFYADGLTDDELVALAVAGHLEGGESEVAIMRVMVRKCGSTGNVRGGKEGMDALRGLLKLRRQMEEAQTDRVVSNLDRVLDSIAAEMGIKV